MFVICLRLHESNMFEHVSHGPEQCLQCHSIYIRSKLRRKIVYGPLICAIPTSNHQLNSIENGLST